MKVRWRAYEMIAVGMLVAWQVIMILLQAYDHSMGGAESPYSTAFREHGLSFIYWRNVLVPQLASMVLMYGVYLMINLIILPLFRLLSGKDLDHLGSGKIIKAILSLAAVSFLLAIGINVISFYGMPHLLSYRDYQFLSIAGYNDAPLSNLFFGFSRSLAVVLLITVLAGLREVMIGYLERSGGRREYTILIVNNAIPLIFLYGLWLVVTRPSQSDVFRYNVLVLPLIAFYLYLTFWLFPFKGEKSFLTRSVLFRLLLATTIALFPGLVFLFSHNQLFMSLLHGLVLLFVATPLCWILYLQRRDKIVQFLNMKTALARSEANLQFLKAQINPHFLFNALNTLYGTALRGDHEKTAEGIQKLGDMMRFMLHENTQERIPMQKELEYLRNFISLQQLRIQASPGIQIEDNIEDVSSNLQIAPMMLIPFVENAFKHGISLKEPSWIVINLSCAEDGTLHFEVRNSFHKREGDLESGKSGVGLANVQGRLALLYPGRHSLRLDTTEKEYIVNLSLKC